MAIDRRLLLLSLGTAALGGCANGLGYGIGSPPPRSGSPRVQRVDPAAFPDVAFASWSDVEPEYVLYPGDEIEVVTPTAPELSRTQKIAPDGRVSLPLIGQVMAADRTIAELERDIVGGYASQLRNPLVEVTLKQAGPLKVWVDGEVKTPGVYDMPGDIDAYQALVLAGGVLPTGREHEVALIRRGPGSLRMLRAVDLRPRRAEVIALRRGDILFVPRSTLGEIANFITQVRAALPIDFSYAINGRYQSF